MIIEGEFNQNTVEVQHHEFMVKDKTSISIILRKGLFEHYFLVIKDPEGNIRGLLTFKTRMKKYTISDNIQTSSNYTKPGKIQNGIWTIDVVRTYNLNSNYEIEILFDLNDVNRVGENLIAIDFDKIYNIRKGWYRGDLHCHSYFSDGRVTHEQLLESAKQMQLDYVAITEHSTFTSKIPSTELLVIPSTEVTCDNDGHYNIHGLKDLIDYSAFFKNNYGKSNSLDDMFKYFSEQGCVLSINHPFPYGWILNHEFDIRSFKLLEVINSPHLLKPEVDNERAVLFFDFLWNHGYYLYASGGSDAHKCNYFDEYPVGYPTTKIYCENGLSISNILDSLCRGYCFIQNLVDCEISYFKTDDSQQVILPGMMVKGKVKMLARCKQKIQWELIKNGNIVYEIKSRFFNYEVDVKENEYYRLQARLDDGELVLFVNPIHQMTIKARDFKFQNILNQFYMEEGNYKL